MTSTKRIALLALTGAVLLGASQAGVASAKSCGNMEPNGITKLRASGVSCERAAEVAREFSYRMPPPQGDRTRVSGWRCKAKSVSRRHENVTCKRKGRRIRFRSTKQIELPPASAPPCVNCSGRTAAANP